MQNIAMVPTKVMTSAYTHEEPHAGAIKNYDECLHPLRTSFWCPQKLRQVLVCLQNLILVQVKIMTSAYTHK